MTEALIIHLPASITREEYTVLLNDISEYGRQQREAAKAEERARLAEAVRGLPADNFYDDYEAGTYWWAVDRAAVLALLEGPE